jgi:hypothetical protein
MRLAPCSLILLALLPATPLRAQAVAAGVTAGAVKLTPQRSEQAVTGILQLQARSWLSFSATPSFVHVSDVVSGRAVSSNGSGDLPLSADAFHAFRALGSPVVGAALTVVLPTGNAACGLGSGATSVGLDLGAGASPSPRLHLAADASRSIGGGLSAQSTLSAPHATSLRGEASYDLSPRWTTNVSLGADVGQVDSTQALSRTLGAGLTHAVGRLTLTLDASVGLSAASPKWALSVGLGRVFAGTSPVSPSSGLRRLKSNFTGGVSRGNGGGKIGCR